MCAILRQGYRTPAGRRQIRVADVGDGVSLFKWLAQHDVHQLVAFAVLPHSDAAQARAGTLGDGLAANAQTARLRLINVQAQHLDLLVPVVVDATHAGVGPQQVFDLVCVLAHLLKFRAHHAELHRISHGGPIGQHFDPATHL